MARTSNTSVEQRGSGAPFTDSRDHKSENSRGQFLAGGEIIQYYSWMVEVACKRRIRTRDH